MALRTWFRRLIGRAERPTMGLVLGADSCRYVLSGCDGVRREPSVLWRRRESGRILIDEQAIGDMAEGMLIHNYLHEAYSMDIGPRMARHLLVSLGNRALWPMEATGREWTTGLPAMVSANTGWQPERRPGQDGGSGNALPTRGPSEAVCCDLVGLSLPPATLS